MKASGLIPKCSDYFRVVVHRSLSLSSSMPSSSIASASLASFASSPSSSSSISSRLPRISKIIADSGLCSRREAEKWIIEGRVTLSDNKRLSPAHLIQPNDVVHLDGVPLTGPGINLKSKGNIPAKDQLPKLWAVHKLRGELVAHKDDNRQRPLMFDRLHALGPLTSLKPVVYQEFGTEGLVLVTNHSRLAKVLSSPSTELIKHYRLRINGLLTDSKVDGLRRGMFIEGKRQPLIDLRVESSSRTMSWVSLSTLESRSKVIKTCLEHMHINVTRIICTGFGPYNLGKLAPGQSQQVHLAPEVLNYFRKKL